MRVSVKLSGKLAGEKRKTFRPSVARRRNWKVYNIMWGRWPWHHKVNISLQKRLYLCYKFQICRYESLRIVY